MKSRQNPRNNEQSGPICLHNRTFCDCRDRDKVEVPQNTAFYGNLRETMRKMSQYACIIGHLTNVATSSDSEMR